MLRRVTFTRSGLQTSRLGFGTSRLHYLDSRSRARLLETAVSLGITHIDTAPAYGDTAAELEIGKVLRSCRDRLVIVSKYGIPPNALIAAMPSLATPIRGARALSRRFGLTQAARPQMTAEGLRRSVEQSLRRLRTDWLDILLLHEPSRSSLTSVEAIYRELLSLRGKGYIRFFGLAGAWKGITGLGEDAAKIGQIVQTGENEWTGDPPPDITYGAISAGPQSYFGDTVTPMAAKQRLRAALKRRPYGAVIVSTKHAEHLQSLAEIGAAS